MWSLLPSKFLFFKLSPYSDLFATRSNSDLFPVEEVEAVRESSSIEFRNLEPMRFQGEGGQHWRCRVEWLAKDFFRMFRYKETMLRLCLGIPNRPYIVIHCDALWESTSEFSPLKMQAAGQMVWARWATTYRYHVLPSTPSTTFSQKYGHHIREPALLLMLVIVS